MNKMHCPHCWHELSEGELKKLWAEYCGSKTTALKAKAARENGAKGGRPMTYFQSLYDAIPESIAAFTNKLRQERARHQFEFRRSDESDPANTGFDLSCDDIIWHCSWDGYSDFISIVENQESRAGISRINYAANRAAQRLVQDIHREKLMRMPEDPSDLIAWVEQQTGKPFKAL
jgi:hypothetical protein